MSSRSRSRCRRRRELLAAALLAAALSACQREDRRFRTWPPAASALPAVRQSPLQPGPTTRDLAVRNEYEGNAWAVYEGKRLYNQFNCSGCHFQGGGGIGPPLMDSQWIYGSQPENIFATIIEGRPNGMPSFRGKLGNDQVWKLVAYVRSMSGLLRKDVAPSRSDSISTNQPENARPEQKPQPEKPPTPTPPGAR
jgi:cytochrome c oxidase cbb3-type subunit III